MIYHNLVKKENGHSKSGRDDMVLEDTNWMKELNVFSTVVDDSCRKQ